MYYIADLKSIRQSYRQIKTGVLKKVKEIKMILKAVKICLFRSFPTPGRVAQHLAEVRSYRVHPPSKVEIVTLPEWCVHQGVSQT